MPFIVHYQDCIVYILIHLFIFEVKLFIENSSWMDYDCFKMKDKFLEQQTKKSRNDKTFTTVLVLPNRKHVYQYEK